MRAPPCQYGFNTLVTFRAAAERLATNQHRDKQAKRHRQWSGVRLTECRWRHPSPFSPSDGINDGGPVMLSKTAIALAAASLAVGASAFTPAMANYAPCVRIRLRKVVRARSVKIRMRTVIRARSIRPAILPVITASRDKSWSDRRGVGFGRRPFSSYRVTPELPPDRWS